MKGPLETATKAVPPHNRLGRHDDSRREHLPQSRDYWLYAEKQATIRELKEQSGKDIWLWGSLKLMHSLLDAGVLDEVRMLVCPVSCGKGRCLFEDRQDLKLVEAAPFENGVVLLRYEIQN
jgi:dihydrofolate reductase